MTEKEKLLFLICKGPTDKLLRLAYADLLEEEGNLDRVVFIRHGVLKQTVHQCVRMADEIVTARAKVVWPSAYQARAEDLPKGVEFIYKNGFIEHVILTLEQLKTHGKLLFSLHPVMTVSLTDRAPDYWPGHPDDKRSILFYHWVRDGFSERRERLPEDIFSRLTGYPVNKGRKSYRTRFEAESDVSRACVAWCRKMVGLD